MRRGLFTIAGILAILWVALTGSAAPVNLAQGLGIGVLIAYLTRRLYPPSPAGGHSIRVGASVMLALTFVWNVVRASLQVARYILTPGYRLNSGVIRVPTETDSEALITVIANMISLTPGTLTLDHDSDGSCLFVHVMHVAERDTGAARERIQRRIVRPVLRAFSPPRPHHSSAP